MFVSTPRLIRATKQANAKGAATVLYGGMTAPGYNRKLIESEPLAAPWLSKMVELQGKQMKYIDHVFALSSFSAENYIDDGIPSENVHVTPLGISEDWKVSNTGEENRKCRFLFVGNMQGLKGERCLVKSWKKADLKDDRSELLVCGKPQNKVKKLMRGFSRRHSNVRLMGYVEEVKRVYGKSSVFVFPSLSEGRPKVVLEAMRMGLPIISTPVVKDIVTDYSNGFVVDFKDHKSLSRRIKWCYKNKAKINQMGRKSQKISNSQTMKRFVNKVNKASGIIHER
jgi:glycosyltransferase involved in cell wall biosynthesis